MLEIKQSVAKRVVFKAYLAGTATLATGKTIAVTISKNGGAFGNPNAGATNATEISSGWYYADLNTTDTNTVGPLAIRGAEGTIDDVGVLYEVTADFATLDGKLDTIDNLLDTEIASIIATLATMDGKLDTIDNLLDTEIASIITSLATLSTDVGNVPTAAENATELLDQAAGVETGLTVRQALRGALAMLAAKISGAGTGTETFRNAVADSANRLVITVDPSGNRTAITYNL